MAKARQNSETRPTCPYCKKLCGAGSTQFGMTYYYCKNDDCEFPFSVKVPVPEIEEILEHERTQPNFDPRK